MLNNKTRMVCTIGPASNSPEVISDLIKAGMNVARLNFSHGTREDHLKTAEMIKQIRQELQSPIALMLDTKGPEIRIKTFKQSSIELKPQQLFTLTSRDVEGTSEIVSVTYEDLTSCLEIGTKVLIDDGLIELVVEDLTATDIICRVVNGGILSDKKSINLPGIKIDMPYLDEKDTLDIALAYENNFDYIALSFVRTAKDVLLVKRLFSNRGQSSCKLLAKIENVIILNPTTIAAIGINFIIPFAVFLEAK